MGFFSDLLGLTTDYSSTPDGARTTPSDWFSPLSGAAKSEPMPDNIPRPNGATDENPWI